MMSSKGFVRTPKPIQPEDEQEDEGEQGEEEEDQSLLQEEL